MSVPLHINAVWILQRLRQGGVTALYHFTGVKNLRSIREMNALCSKAVLETAGCWPCPEPGGNSLSHSLDSVNGNWDKVSMSFTPHTPMVYRRKRMNHLCFFVLRVEVAAYAGVIFTDRNAASMRGQRRGEGFFGVNLVDFEAIRFHRPWDREGWVEPVQAEVLVPGKVSLEDVKEVAFVSEASLEEGERIWGMNTPHPPFRVEPRYFRDSPHGGTSELNFSRLNTLGLTNELINKSTVNSHRTYYSRFHRQRQKRITAVANVYALAGTQGKIIWHPAGYTTVEEFQRSTGYWHWSSVPVNELPDGICFVEYYLNEVRWAWKWFRLIP